MKADSRIFGQIEIEDDKIITLEKGMIGFPDLNHFALIYDEEKEKIIPTVEEVKFKDFTSLYKILEKAEFMTTGVF